MKKILLGFIAIGLLTFIGCEQEDTDDLGGNNTTNTLTDSSNCDGSAFTWNDVTSPTGRIWMDRNLGASQVATSSTDSNSYGDLYQWGRGKDGHECRGSNITSSLSSKDEPDHQKFIIPTSLPGDWRNPQKDILWQGENGINNPCPDGYRLPTQMEWDEEVDTWTSNGGNGGFGSVLKLTMGGKRVGPDSISFVGMIGSYWSSTEAYGDARGLQLTYIGEEDWGDFGRAAGNSVRCIRD